MSRSLDGSRLEPRDLELLRDLPQGVGIIPAADHADDSGARIPRPVQ
jgi:hypothetical protein